MLQSACLGHVRSEWTTREIHLCGQIAYLEIRSPHQQRLRGLKKGRMLFLPAKDYEKRNYH